MRQAITQTNRSTAAAINALRAREYAAYRYGYDPEPPTREEYTEQLEAVRCALIEVR